MEVHTLNFNGGVAQNETKHKGSLVTLGTLKSMSVGPENRTNGFKASSTILEASKAVTNALANCQNNRHSVKVFLRTCVSKFSDLIESFFIFIFLNKIKFELSGRKIQIQLYFLQSFVRLKKIQVVFLLQVLSKLGMEFSLAASLHQYSNPQLFVALHEENMALLSFVGKFIRVRI